MRISDWSSDVCSSDLLAYALRLVDRAQLKAINLRLLVGKRLRRAEIVPLAESYADRVVARGLHPAALDQIAADRAASSEERRAGKESVSTCRSRWSPYP